MISTMRFPVSLGFLSLLTILSAGPASAQTDIAKAIQQKLAARAEKLESACAGDIRKYCSNVTRGEGRMIYCMQAHEDKITPKCAFEVEEATNDMQLSMENLKEAVKACQAEIKGVCGTTQPGQGRIAGCLLANKSTASAGCIEALQKVEAMAAQ